MRLPGAKHLLIWALALALGACATAPQPPPAPEVKVEVVRNGSEWTANYSFDRDAAAWGFFRSALTEHGRKPWRPVSWAVTTPGVRLERRGRYDLLVSDAGTVPREVSISFRPFADRLLSDYDAAILFSDGTVGLFSDHFNVFPLPSAAAAETLPLDLDSEAMGTPPTRISFRDRNGPVLHAGGRSPEVSLVAAENYVLFGPAEPVQNEHIATVIDPALPEWLRKPLTNSTLRILSFYGDKLGPRAGDKPMLLVSWAGPTKGLRSIGGGVVPGQVMLRFEGEALLNEDPAARDSARWAVAHEGAHFWLGNTVGYASSDQAWIMEGGADLLAVRATSALEPDFNARTMLQNLADECVTLSAGKAVREAALRNEQRAYYACGAMFALAAEAAARRNGGDYFSFWRGLIDANRADGTVSQEEWLAEVTRLSEDPLIAANIRQMVDVGVADPARSLAAIFIRAGVPHSLAAGGRLLLS